MALPHVDHAPTGLAQAFGVSSVALAVSRDLGQPEICSGLWDDRVTAAFVTVPEASVDKNDRPPTR